MAESMNDVLARLDATISALEKLEKKMEKIDFTKFSKLSRLNLTMSEDTNEIAAALSKAQGDMSVASLDSTNPYFKSKYADFATIVRASRPALTKHGLAVTQQIIVGEDGQTMLHTILMHSSGQYIESRMRVVPAKNDLQTLGSCITYLKRYAYSALVGVTASDEDDDGERAMAPARTVAEKGVALNAKYDPRNETADTISKDQLAELEYELTEYPDIAEQVLDGLKIQSLADMPKSKYRAALDRIRSIKAARNNPK